MIADANKKNGFTLVELMVSLVVLMLLVGGVVFLMNSFSAKAGLDEVKETILSNLRLVRGLAISMQEIDGTGGVNLRYVQATLDDGGLMTVRMVETDGSSAEYFSRDLTGDGISTVMTPNPVIFGAYDGRVGQGDGVFFGPGETAAVVISSNIPGSVTRKIILGASGVIDER